MLIKLVQLENGKYFFQKKIFFLISADILFIIAWGGMHRSGDEKLVTLYDTNLKLAIIKPF